MKHTPGPWYVEGHAIKVFQDFRQFLGPLGGPETVCEMNSSLSPEATANNARLMAAAPELLKVLAEFVEDVRVAYIGTQTDDQLKYSALAHQWPDLCVTYRKAKAVIAKATAVTADAELIAAMEEL